MKKFYTILLVLAVTFSVTAQQQVNVLSQQEGITLTSVDRAEVKSFQAEKMNTKGTASSWFHHMTAIETFTGVTLSDYYYQPLFPDTTMRESGDIADGNIFYHSIAVSLDPAADVWFNTPSEWNEFTNYTLDSIAFGYLYTRNTASTVVDTLVMQVQVNTWGYTVAAATYPWVSTIYSVQEMRVPAILRDPLSPFSSSVDANVIMTMKFPLTAADTASNPKYLERAINSLGLMAGEEIKASFTFVPGYSWTANTDSIQMYNEFGFLSFGDASNGTYPFYFEEDMNCSQTMRTFSYRDATDDTFEPVFFFIDNPFPYQYHDIYFKLNALNTSVENENANISVGQGFPNPTSGEVSIPVEFDGSTNVSVDVYNMTGAKLMSVDKGVMNSGSNMISLDLSTLPSGMYYVTINANEHRITRNISVLN